MNIFKHQNFLAIYSGVLTIAFAAVILIGARNAAPNASFDQITVHRINIVEPNGLTRMVISDKAEFPGEYYMGKEYPRRDREATGMLFNDEEGTENGGLIFGGGKDKDGVTHSWGHLSFDEYQRDQTLVLESDSDGKSRATYYAINDDDTPNAITPEVLVEAQRWKAMPHGPARAAAYKAFQTKYPPTISRAFFGRDRDKSVSLVLKDQHGNQRLVARVAPDGTPVLEFLDANGKVVRSIGPDTK